MPNYNIAGINVDFPFEPYDVQRAYMEKVILCLNNGTNGVLESPTGTGKTLSLLCASLGWVASRKIVIQRDMLNTQANIANELEQCSENDILKVVLNGATSAGSSNTGASATNWAVPKIIYASRTHSQLTQAMQELKRTSYAFMRAVVLGSRDQLCIHPEVIREPGNSNKIQLCKLRVQSHNCAYYSRVDSRKEHNDFRGPSIMDIEDLIKVGQKLKMCPYYGSKELIKDADIIFMPYNYLLDPKARKANKIELNNTIVIIDEAHNIEKICEESVSVQIRSSDIAMAIKDITFVMNSLTGNGEEEISEGIEPKDFSLEDLAFLKLLLLNLEGVINDIVINDKDGATYPANFMFKLLEDANLTESTYAPIQSLLDKLLQYLLVSTKNVLMRRGQGLAVFSDLLSVVFMNKTEMLEKVYRSFKVHVELEDIQKKTGGNKSSSSALMSYKPPKIINYWCFNPGFGMDQLLNAHVRSVILTSGTLAPLKPLISELAIRVAEQLENPHIVSESQVYVKIIGFGPDREQLISNYINRNNPKYISSLGQTILNVVRMVPDGILVFFPSYTSLDQCVNFWQSNGLWSNIAQYKTIIIEPRTKDTFNSAIDAFYQAISVSTGACFMAVCRGKVSEGLDFADRNGRTVIITGLPYPPLKDPKIILKKRYLNENRNATNELLNGQEWYDLDAMRAVNQAIGRIIRHKNDYGAILLCDARFQNSAQIQQLPKWIRHRLDDKNITFGPVVRELRDFFRNAQNTFGKPTNNIVKHDETSTIDESEENNTDIFHTVSRDESESCIVTRHHFGKIKEKTASTHSMAKKIENANTIKSWTPEIYANATGKPNTGKMPSAMDFMSRLEVNVSAIDFNCSNASTTSGTGLVKIHQDKPSMKKEHSADATDSNAESKKKRYKIVANNDDDKNINKKIANINKETATAEMKQLTAEEHLSFLRSLRESLTNEEFELFSKSLFAYKQNNDFDELMVILIKLLGKLELLDLMRSVRRYLKIKHQNQFDEHVLALESQLKG